MAWKIELTTKEDLDFALGLFAPAVDKAKHGISKFTPEAVARILSFYEALQGAVEVEGSAPTPEPEPAKKKKRAPRGSRYLPQLCEVHPTYGAVRMPRTDCADCWSAYKALHPLEYQNKRREFERKLRATT